MLQATEQNLGLALSREILAADALADGRLVQLSPVSIVHREAQPYHFVYPPSLRDWPPLQALRQWLRDELDRSQQDLRARAGGAGKRPRRRGT
jgi:LysR family glycine cleavage system transcriptional activator